MISTSPMRSSSPYFQGSGSLQNHDWVKQYVCAAVRAERLVSSSSCFTPEQITTQILDTVQRRLLEKIKQKVTKEQVLQIVEDYMAQPTQAGYPEHSLPGTSVSTSSLQIHAASKSPSPSPAATNYASPHLFRQNLSPQVQGDNVQQGSRVNHAQTSHVYTTNTQQGTPNDYTHAAATHPLGLPKLSAAWRSTNTEKSTRSYVPILPKSDSLTTNQLTTNQLTTKTVTPPKENYTDIPNDVLQKLIEGYDNTQESELDSKTIRINQVRVVNSNLELLKQFDYKQYLKPGVPDSYYLKQNFVTHAIKQMKAAGLLTDLRKLRGARSKPTEENG